MSNAQFIAIVFGLILFIAVQMDGGQTAAVIAVQRVGRRVLKANQRLWGKRHGLQLIDPARLVPNHGWRRKNDSMRGAA